MRSRAPVTVVHATRQEHRRQLEIEPQLGVAIAFALYALAFLVMLRWHPFSERTFVAITDVQGVFPPLVAAGLAFLAGADAGRHVRQGWWCIGAACLLWGLGDVTWTVYEVVLQQDPFPSIADAGYLAMLPLMATGLVLLTSERRRLVHARPTLDGVAFAMAGTALVWLTVLHPAYSQSGASMFEKLVSAAYPVGDLVLVYALAVGVQSRWGRREGMVLSALLGGMLLLIMSDVGFAYLTLHDRYGATSLVNLGWPSGFLAIAYAGALGSSWRLTYDADIDTPVDREWRMPAALAVVVVALLVAALREDSAAVSIPLYVMVGVSALAVAARLAINFGLVREVEEQRERVITWLLEQRQRPAA